MERAVYQGGQNAHLLTFQDSLLKGIFIFAIVQPNVSENTVLTNRVQYILFLAPTM